MNDSDTRLNKYLALQLGISRREADELIQQGKVALNGQTAVLGSKIRETDDITVLGKPLHGAATLETLLFHKPTGYVCSRRAQGSTPTIYDLIPKKYHHLKPVGRLDKDSSGLLLLTNDGDFAHSMTHPNFRKTKVYEVQLDKPLQPLHQQMISDFGVMLEDGKSQLMVTRLEESSRSIIAASQTKSEEQPLASPVPETEEAQARNGLSGSNGREGDVKALYQITMTEGRNRQIRRTFAALGYAVTSLHRTQFGAYSLGDLKSGKVTSVEP